jgi:hypothetical protein
MVYPREILNMLRWKEGESLAEATIWYIHRGEPGDVMRVRGSTITGFRPGFFEMEDTTIPFHRVLRIDYRGETLFEKDARAKGLS